MAMSAGQKDVARLDGFLAKRLFFFTFLFNYVLMYSLGDLAEVNFFSANLR